MINSSCKSDAKILMLLKSSETEDVIIGAFYAGESEKQKFVPLLLQNADDERTSINLRFKGITIYQAKMIALKKIFKKEPPVPITFKVDSSVIVFYKNLANNL